MNRLTNTDEENKPLVAEFWITGWLEAVDRIRQHNFHRGRVGVREYLLTECRADTGGEYVRVRATFTPCPSTIARFNPETHEVQAVPICGMIDFDSLFVGAFCPI